MAAINAVSALAQSPHVNKKLPAAHSAGSSYTTNPNDSLFGADDAFPIIDYSMLVSDDPVKRSHAIENLGKACLEFGFFAVMNHGIPDSLFERLMEELLGFFDLAEEEKRKYETNNPTDRIRWGRGNTNHVSREFIKMAAHPLFHCPNKPPKLKEVLQEYTKRARQIGVELLRGISRNLGLEEIYIEKKAGLESGYDFFTVNDYPPRLLSENRIGQFPHTDPGLLILLIQNVSGGLQLEHQGKWLNANLNPNWIIVNLADHLEILTNGKYKSKIHRVVVNNEERRVTLPLFLGPSLDAVVSPAPELVDEDHPPAYRPMTYRDYLEANGHHVIEGKSCLKQIKLLN